MYQLCTTKDLAKRDRWPKPLEHHKADINLLVTTAHGEYTKQESQKQSGSTASKPAQSEALLEILRLLAGSLEDVGNDRQKWWSSPEKRDQRRRLEEEHKQQKLGAVHKIINDVNERVEAMNAKLGLFVKWSLGMNGGIWELQEGHKVNSDAGSKKDAEVE